MFLLEQLLPPLAVSAAVGAAVSALAHRGRDVRATRALAACALGTGYFAGHVFITGWTSFPPVDTINWLPYFAMMAAALGWLSSLIDSKAARNAQLFLIYVGAMRLLLAPNFKYGWSMEVGWLWLGGLGCITLLQAVSLTAVARRSSFAMELPLLMTIVSAGIAGALMLSGSLLLGQFAAVFSAAVVGSLALTSRRRIDSDIVAPVFSLVGMALLACGYFFAELPAWSAVLLALAPAGALVYNGSSTPRRAVARVAVVSAAVGGALLVAFCSSPPWSG